MTLMARGTPIIVASTSVALASENFNAQSSVQGRLPVNDNGSAFLHGGTLGLEVGW